MNANEFTQIAARIGSMWPGKINDEQLAFLWDRIAKRIPAVDLDAAISVRAANPIPPSVADLISAASDIVTAKARSAAVRRSSCRMCDGTGFVVTRDRDGYEYAFRCACACKPISESIPLWSDEFARRGFRPVLESAR